MNDLDRKVANAMGLKSVNNCEKWGREMTEEDEAFNEIERQAKQRKESVMAAVHTLTEYQRGYENGFIDGMQKQMQSSVDKAVNAMSQRTEQEPVAYDKTEMNCFVQELYERKMQEGKHGHYETIFHCVHQAVARATPPQRTWVGLTVEEIAACCRESTTTQLSFAQELEAKLKEKNT